MATEAVRPVHHRISQVLEPGDHEAWLDASGGPEVALALLRSAPSAVLKAVPISTRVNSVRNDGPELLEPVEAV